MRKIVFLDRSTIAPQIRLRRPNFEHELIEHASTSPEQVVERLRGATVAILNKVPLSAATLAQLPDLRLIAVAATGTDCVDKTYCEAHGIAVANIRGGSEYGEDCIESETVKRGGGTIHIVQRLPGLSTSGLLDALRPGSDVR